MPPENNQNFNNPMSQQPQKNKNNLNTILLILLIALVGFGVWFLSERKEEKKDITLDVQEIWSKSWVRVGSTYLKNATINTVDVTPTNFAFDLFMQNGQNNFGTWTTDTDLVTIDGLNAHFKGFSQVNGEKSPLCTADFSISSDYEVLTIKTDCDKNLLDSGLEFDGIYKEDTENNILFQINENDEGVVSVTDSYGSGEANPEEFWNFRKDEIKKVILSSVNPVLINGDIIDINQIVDATGDGIPEAFVYYGAGGATTSNSAIMYIKNGVVYFAKAKYKDGTIGNFEVVSGAGGMYSIKYGTVPGRNVVYQTETQNQYNEDGSAIISKTCTLDAYKWNAQVDIFEYSASESDLLKSQYCI